MNWFLQDKMPFKSLILANDGRIYNVNESMQFDVCLLKLDTPIDVDINTLVSRDKFDLALRLERTIQTTSENSVEIIYSFDNQVYCLRKGDKFSFDYTSDWSTNREKLKDRKIVGIAFTGKNDDPISTFLDTTDYNLVLDSNVLTIERKDIFSTEAICNGYDYPYHLAPIPKTKMISNEEKQIYAQLYSVGLGAKLGKLSEEYVLNQDNRDSWIYSKFTFENEKKYPLFPSNSLYPLENFYPIQEDILYIILKYKLCYYNQASDKMIPIGEEYTMNIRTDKKGIITLQSYFLEQKE